MADNPASQLDGTDRQDLLRAVEYLENPSFAARVTELIGGPLEKAIKALPEPATRTINLVTEKAMNLALDLSLVTMRKGKCDASPRIHKLASAITGAVGGAAGAAGLAVELPITTTIIFRSIADIARAEGEELNDPAVCLACLEVFALGGPQVEDDAADSAYFAARVALAKSIREATRYLAKGATKRTAPALVRLIGKIATRFGVTVSYKAAAQIVPIIGAVGGATINTLFMAHFQAMARGHFTVRRLERKYGSELVRACYQQLMSESGAFRKRRGRPGPAVADTDIEVDFEVVPENRGNHQDP